MAIRAIDAHFTKERRYFENSVGKEFDFTSLTGPYEYLLGALSGCFISTLLAILGEGFSYSSLDVRVEGEKRKEVPTTLKSTRIKIHAKGISERDAFEAAIKEASDKCSIYQTIKKVSDISVEVSYGA